MQFVKYFGIVRYLLFFLTLFLVVFAIKVYINSIYLDRQIIKTNEDIISYKNNIFFNENFYSKYLSSKYAKYFISHQNNIVLPEETRIFVSIDKRNNLKIRKLTDIENSTWIEILFYQISKYFKW